MSSESFHSAAGGLMSLDIGLNNEFNTIRDHLQDRIFLNEIASDLHAISVGPILLLVLQKIGLFPVAELKEKLENIRKFYKKIKEKAQTVENDVIITATMLKREGNTIRELSTEAKYSTTLMNADSDVKEDLIESAENLINKCQKYRQTHLLEDQYNIL